MDEFTVDHSVCRRLRKDAVAHCWVLARKFVLGISLALVCQCALAQAMYRIKPLGSVGGCTYSTPGAAALNGADQVTGNINNCSDHGGDRHAFLWMNNGTPMVDLGPHEVGSTSAGLALNASGLVTGIAQDSTGEFAFVSSGDGTPMTRIYDGWGGTFIEPYAINDLGQLTGRASISDFVEHAFLWKNNGSPLRDLGTLGGASSVGHDINAFGQVAGTSDLPGNAAHHATVWRNDGTRTLDLGTLGGNFSEGLLINASGQVAGYSRIILNRMVRNHAFFWRNDGTPMQDLGTLGGYDSFAVALNDSGQIAGNSFKHGRLGTNQRAFVWLNDGTPMKDLGIFSGSLSQANDINSSGQVTGYAYLSSLNADPHAFLWRNDGTKTQDLNALIDPTDPLRPYITLTHGDFINGPGDIVADGKDNRTGLYGLYLLKGTVLTLTPRSRAFGNQANNTASAAKSVTVTNTSAKVVAITSIALKGSGSGQFASTNNCGSSLVGHATCTIKVTFKPTTKGAKSATLNVNGGGGGLRVVNLTGTGI